MNQKLIRDFAVNLTYLLAVKSSFPVLSEGNKIAVNLKLTIEATIGMKMDAVVTLLLNSKILEK